MLASCARSAARRFYDDTHATGTVLGNLPTYPSGTMPDFVAYEALNVRGLAAGSSYADPVTGRSVLKVTDGAFPSAGNASATCGQYSSGAPPMSLPWGPSLSMRTIALGDSNGTYLVDYSETTGAFTNKRAAPWVARDLQFGFSFNPATPQICYYLKNVDVGAGTDTRHIARFDTTVGVMADAPLGHFPKSLTGVLSDTYVTWFQFDQSDRVFAFCAGSSNEAGFWDSATDLAWSQVWTVLDEPHLSADGAILLVDFNGTSGVVRTADGVVTHNPTSHGAMGHPAVLRGGNVLQHGGGPNGDIAVRYNMVSDVETTLAISGRALTGAYVDAHRANQWKQANTDVLDDALLIVSEQSSLFSTRSWALASGAAYSAAGIYGMGLAGPNSITHVFQKNSAGTSLTQRLTKVANVAAITAPGQFCYVGNTLTVRAFGDLDLTVTANADKIHYYDAAGLGPYGIGFYQARGDTPSRFLCHHYSSVWTGVYGEASFACVASPDGKYVAFQSTMNLEGGRHDGFLVRVY